jgi:carboxypeptidase T
LPPNVGGKLSLFHIFLIFLFRMEPETTRGSRIEYVVLIDDAENEAPESQNLATIGLAGPWQTRNHVRRLSMKSTLIVAAISALLAMPSALISSNPHEMREQNSQSAPSVRDQVAPPAEDKSLQPPSVDDPGALRAVESIVAIELTTQSDIQVALKITPRFLSCQLSLGVVPFVISADQIDALSLSGLKHHVIASDADAWVRERARANDARRQNRNWFDAYHPNDEITSYLEQLMIDSNGRATLVDVGHSWEQRTIRALRVTGDGCADDRPALLLIGCQHAREWIAASTAVYIADKLVHDYATDTQIRDFLDRAIVYVLPVANPDGYEFSWVDSANRFWRMNRRPNSNPAHVGVDLNRNWDIDFSSGGDYVEGTYSGPSAFSEPESAALQAFVTANPAIKALVDFHSYGELILMPYGYRHSSPSGAAGARYAQLNNSMLTQMASVGHTYTAGTIWNLRGEINGSMVDYVFENRSIWSWGIELRPLGSVPDDLADFDPDPDQIIPTGSEAYEATKVLLDFLSSEYYATGVCCLPDGTCIATSPVCCANDGGSFSAQHDCGPAGACCLPDGTCRATTEACCSLYGGAFTAGGDCSASGSCCRSDGSCVETTLDCCTALAGSFSLGGTCVRGGGCVAPGACCMPDGTCTQSSEADCTAAGGTFSAGASCAGTGACCLPDGHCVQTTSDCCIAAGGTFSADGDCANSGACRIGDTCIDTTAACCAAAGGSFREGESCDSGGCEIFPDDDNDAVRMRVGMRPVRDYILPPSHLRGAVQASIDSAHELIITGTSGVDHIRLMLKAGDPSALEIYCPETTLAPSFTFLIADFASISINLGDDTDLLVYDDSNGIVSSIRPFTIATAGGDDIVLTRTGPFSLEQTLDLIDDLQSARDLMLRADTLRQLAGAVPMFGATDNLISRAVGCVRSAEEDLIEPAARYAADARAQLIEPAGAAPAAIRAALIDPAMNLAQRGRAELSLAAQALTADARHDLVDVAQALLANAEADLRAAAGSVSGCTGALQIEAATFTQHVDRLVNDIVALAARCPEEPQEPPLAATGCPQLQDLIDCLEREIEQFEELADACADLADAAADEGDRYDALGNDLEATADQYEIRFDNFGDELDTPNVSVADAFNSAGEAFERGAETFAADLAGGLESAGERMADRAEREFVARGAALETRANTELAALADALSSQADLLTAEAEAICLTATVLLDGETRGAAVECNSIETTNTILGGAGLNFLIGSTGNDRIEGFGGPDVIIGAAGDDRLFGGDGPDLIFGGSGTNEIHGG